MDKGSIWRTPVDTFHCRSTGVVGVSLLQHHRSLRPDVTRAFTLAPRHIRRHRAFHSQMRWSRVRCVGPLRLDGNDATPRRRRRSQAGVWRARADVAGHRGNWCGVPAACSCLFRESRVCLVSALSASRPTDANCWFQILVDSHRK